MSSGQKRKILIRGVARTVSRIEGMGQAFRIVLRKNGDRDHVIVEAETTQPVSDAQIDVLSAKLLDALTVEMDDVVREVTSAARGRLTLRVVQPGTLPRDPLTGKIRQVVASCAKVH
jgi:phenylacetate-coenzyme A ligase PaaK-like adenylate-forming protein